MNVIVTDNPKACGYDAVTVVGSEKLIYLFTAFVGSIAFS